MLKVETVLVTLKLLTWYILMRGPHQRGEEFYGFITSGYEIVSSIWFIDTAASGAPISSLHVCITQMVSPSEFLSFTLRFNCLNAKSRMLCRYSSSGKRSIRAHCRQIFSAESGSTYIRFHRYSDTSRPGITGFYGLCNWKSNAALFKVPGIQYPNHSQQGRNP